MPFPKIPGEKEIEQIMADPQAGDRFQEMYSFWGYVVHRDGDNVVIMTASPPCTFPQDAKVMKCTVAEMRTYFSYDSADGYWVTGAGRGHDVNGWYATADSA